MTKEQVMGMDKVLIISNSCDVSAGWGNITYEYCKELKRKKVSFDLLLPRNHERFDYLSELNPMYELPNAALYYNPYHVIAHMLQRIKKYSGYKLVHSLFSTPEAIIGMRISKRLGIPFIVGEQGTYGILPLLSRINRMFYLPVLRHSCKIICPSRFTSEKMIEFGEESMKEKMSIIHNGVDFGRFQKEVGPADIITKNRDKIIFIGIGGLKKRKGFDIAIKAISKVSRKIDCAYIIVGSGPGEAELKELAEKEGIGGRVRFVGKKTGDELLSHIKHSDIYIHTPVNHAWHFEGFGIVYLEANACGIPVIASKSGGVPDAVVDGKTGFLAKEDDADDTAKKILDIVKKYKSMKKECIKWAKDHDWGKIVDQYLRIYDEALEGR